MTYPLDLIITRLQIQRQLRKDASTPHASEYKSIWDAIEKIYYQEGGIAGFYIGVIPDTSKSIVDSFIFFLAYNFLRQHRLHGRGTTYKSLPAVDELSVGFLAGALTKLLTTPIATIVTRKKASTLIAARSSPHSPDDDTVLGIARRIHSEKGIQGFWSGYSASLVLTLNPSITFFLYESFKRTLLPRAQRDTPSASATFLLAAISKAIASTITYPFSLAKSRAQLSSRTVDENDEDVKAAIEKASNGRTAGTRQGREAARSTVFSTILHIARTEGIGALYEGLGGEVLKGFFSHGITMVIKEAVHSLIIRLYFAILKASQRYPRPQEAMMMAKEQAGQATTNVRDQVQLAITTTKEETQSFSKQAQGVAQSGSAQASEMVNGAWENGKRAANTSFTATSGMVDRGKDIASEASTSALERSNRIWEGTKDAANSAAAAATGLVKRGQENASEASTSAMETSNQIWNNAKEAANSATVTASELATKGQGMVENTSASAMTTTNSLWESTKQSPNTIITTISNTIGRGQELANQVSTSAIEATNDAWETTKQVTDTSPTRTDSLIPQAQNVANATSTFAADSVTEAWDTTNEAANSTTAKANEMAELVGDYVGQKTEALASSMRPNAKGGGGAAGA